MAVSNSEQIAGLAALPTPCPPVSSSEVFTADQWRTLISICEVFLPNLLSSASEQNTSDIIARLSGVLPDHEDKSLIKDYLSETVDENATFKESLRQRFAGYMPQAQIKGLAFLLSALDSKLGSIIMCGGIKSLHTLPLAERSRVVLGWTESYLGPLRALYQACETLTKATWLAESQTLHRLLDYPKVPKDIERHPGFDFKFIDFSNEPAEGIVEVSADVVIVGSGCGAGVVAEHLASSFASSNPKVRILVVEKSYHFPSTHFPMDQSAAGVNIQEAGGGVLSDDGSIAALAGSTWGGGGTINWSASLQPQRHIREEWATKNKLDFALSQEFQDDLDEVCDKMGVCKANDLEGLARLEHNFGNKTLLETARNLGLDARVVPQNSAGKRHYCGRCGMGCASATKQGPANFWFPAAAEHGAEFIEGCFVEQILWDEEVGPNRKAVGVKATWLSRSRDMTRSLRITAKHIVVSSGSLHSPLLLHRSGLTPEVNRHIGSNLHLHPTLTVRGRYAERVNPWDGSILTSVMTSLENLDGQGHGPKIEVMLGTPDINGVTMPYRPHLSLHNKTPNDISALSTALDYRFRVAHLGYTFCYIVIQRDHAEDTNLKKSYVYNDPDNPRIVKINYTASQKDYQHLLEGAITAAQMHYTAGAQTIEICAPTIEPFTRPSTQRASQPDISPTNTPTTTKKNDITNITDDEAFKTFLTHLRSPQTLNRLTPQSTRLGSAHQMSTNRMSASPTDGVVDTQGKIWGTSNVYVADASVLPSATGVNPMVSTMAVALRVARAVGRSVREGLEGEGEG